MAYLITLDSGTTNTRAVLWDGETVAARAGADVGAGATAEDGDNHRLKAAVKDCLEQVLTQAGIGWDRVSAVVASGMITSNMGLLEVPHRPAPAGLWELAEGVRTAELPDVCPLPIHFIPGVKNSDRAVTYDNFEAMDMMRGEEAEVLALLERFPTPKSQLFILPGSHMKFVSVDDEGRITGCLTSISGELLSAITNHTILAGTVGRQFVAPDHYDRGMTLLGYDIAKAVGIGRACFSARILNTFAEKDSQKLAAYLLGAALQSDVTAIQHSSALRVERDTQVIVAGKDPLRRAMLDILEHENCFSDLRSASDTPWPLSARGAWLVARNRGLF